MHADAVWATLSWVSTLAFTPIGLDAATWWAVRRSARWALGLGALSVSLYVARAVRFEEATQVRREALTRHVAVDHLALRFDEIVYDAGGLASIAAGVMACVWLVQAYRAALGLDPSLKRVSDVWLWVMWVLPFVQFVAPPLRLRALQRAVNRTRSSWLVLVWLVVWIPVEAVRRRLAPPELPLDGDDSGLAASMWGEVARSVEAANDVTTWTIGLACAFVLWAALVSTITRDLRRWTSA